MSAIWFVTPAWQRFELTAVCLEQRRRVIEDLSREGVSASCVVVADDENLDTARSLGFDTVERDNEWLGRRFNDGIQYAVEHGATWVVPIGSDSWIDPAYFLPLPPKERGIVRTGEMYAPVEPDRLAILRVTNRANPAGPHMFHRDLLRRRRNRPIPERIKSGVDGKTVRALLPFRFQHRYIHQLQYVGFRQAPLISPYAVLWQHWGQLEFHDPWRQLAKRYPTDLVERAKEAMACVPA